MGKRTILVLAVMAIVVGLLQKTPFAFLPKDAADFVWGLASGLSFGGVIAWFGGRSG